MLILALPLVHLCTAQLPVDRHYLETPAYAACRAGYEIIQTYAACEAARIDEFPSAGSTTLDPWGSGGTDEWPGGCFYNDQQAYFNQKLVGSAGTLTGTDGPYRLCVQVTTSAPSLAPTSTLSGPLVYSTGGPYVPDAGARSGVSAFYVDAVAGDNTNDGLQPLSDGNGAGPWQTVGKALHWDYPPGTHVLFKRGTVYLGGGALDTVGTKLASTEANPFVLGAYGEEALALPKLEYNVQVRGDHITVRDLEMHRVILNGAHILLFRCEVHSMIQPPTASSFVNNLIVMKDFSSYCSVVECLLYDCDGNDVISIHDSSSGGTVGAHHWVVDNTIIGNSGVEQCFDLASTDAFDVKYLNNRCQCTAVPGLSQKTGTSSSGITAAKTAEFVWLVNNVLTGGCTSYGIQMGGHNQQDSGNIVYDISNPTAHNTMIKIVTKKGVSAVSHNTFLQSATGRTPITIEDPANGDRNGVSVTFTHNVLGVKVNEGSIMYLNLPPAVGTGDGNGTIAAFDHNVYMNLNGGTSGIGTVNSQTLTEWQAASGLDTNSGDGDLAGVTVPDATTWADPRTWGDACGSPLNAAFAAHFTPSHFNADGVTPNPYCAKTATPGAFDCDGNRLGVFEPFADFDCVWSAGSAKYPPGARCDTENGGFGWSGPPLIRERYPLRGSGGVLVSGVLVSLAPTAAPTTAPSGAPTMAPSTAPTAAPTTAPSTAPTTIPSGVPSAAPTAAPMVPTTAAAPTLAPTHSEGPNAAALGASDGGSDASMIEVWVIIVLVVAGLAFLVALAIAVAISVAVGSILMKKRKKGEAMLEAPVGTPFGVEMQAQGAGVSQRLSISMQDAFGVAGSRCSNPMQDAFAADLKNFNEKHASYALQSNPSITAAMNIPELRVADDGGQFTKAEFEEHYGRTDEWDAAAVATGNVSQPELPGGVVEMFAHARPERSSVFNRAGI